MHVKLVHLGLSLITAEGFVSRNVSWGSSRFSSFLARSTSLMPEQISLMRCFCGKLLILGIPADVR